MPRLPTRRSQTSAITLAQSLLYPMVRTAYNILGTHTCIFSRILYGAGSLVMTLDVRWSADRGTCCCPLALSSLPLAHTELMSPRCAGMLPGGARAQDLTFATNVISMTSQVSVSRGLSLFLCTSLPYSVSLCLSLSQDLGRSWHFSAVLCSAARHRGCGECCNENTVTVLADGRLLAVWRMGAGDGHKWNHSMSSTDGYQYFLTPYHRSESLPIEH